MICILHGYLLEGSGSNLWTRSIIRSMCRNGETVHLVCQENHPELYDFISHVYHYDQQGQKSKVLQRDVPYSGNCIMHKPWIGDTLPVYVWDKYEEFSDVRPMIQLTDEEIQIYLERNIRIIKQIIRENNITALHANHAVLMSVVAHKISSELSVPFAIMPHGSAIEYAVKKDKRIFDYAHKAFDAAQHIFVIGKEIRDRVQNIFPDIPKINEKMIELNLGADTSLFTPVEPKQRKNNIESLFSGLKNIKRGKQPAMSDYMRDNLYDNIGKEELKTLIHSTSDYNGKLTDFNVEDRLQSIDWENEKLLLFVGRIISGKGFHSILAALPEILKHHPNSRLIVVGHGPLREAMEAFMWALENGAAELAKNIVTWGTDLEDSCSKPLKEIQFFFNILKNENRLNDYFKTAQQFIRPERVIFTGYLTHQELQFLFPACDVAIFPSVVAEAGPLVFLEAMASGCFPIGTYFAGMAASIDSVSGYVPQTVQDIMKLSPDAKETVSDMINKVNGALQSNREYSSDLRRIAVEKYDWGSISKKFAGNLHLLY